MIIVDTNVVSELMRQLPNPAVMEWLSSKARRDIFTTSITRAEIFYGIALLPDGRRKASLASDALRLFAADFRGCVLPFDEDAATQFAEIAAERRRQGLTFDVPDMQIAAIARANSATVATRNVSDFDGCGVEVVDPWAAP